VTESTACARLKAYVTVHGLYGLVSGVTNIMRCASCRLQVSALPVNSSRTPVPPSGSAQLGLAPVAPV